MKTDTPATPYPTFFSLRIRWAGFLGAFGFFVGAVSMAGYLSAHHWIFDLFCHFRFQYALSLLIVTLFFSSIRHWKSAVLFGLILGVNLVSVIPSFMPSAKTASTLGEVFEAFHINVDRAYGDKKAIGEFIEQRNPDLLHLCEISHDWLDELEGVLAEFPHRIVKERNDNFGIGLFSKHPFERASITRIGPADIPSCLAVVQLPEATVTVIGTHPIPPGGWQRSMLRNRQLESLSAGITKATPPVILVGDLNVSPWSSHFQKLLETADLKDSGIGWGFQPTWSANNWFLWTPIDHFLHTSEIRILDRKIGPDVGSDHYPLIVRFAVEKQRETPENPNHERNAEE